MTPHPSRSSPGDVLVPQAHGAARRGRVRGRRLRRLRGDDGGRDPDGQGVTPPPQPSSPLTAYYLPRRFPASHTAHSTTRRRAPPVYQGTYFPGLLPLTYAYLEAIDCDPETKEVTPHRPTNPIVARARCASRLTHPSVTLRPRIPPPHSQAMRVYLDFIRRRATGELQTGAEWMRTFVKAHPGALDASRTDTAHGVRAATRLTLRSSRSSGSSGYSRDSRVTEAVAHDLLRACVDIGEGRRQERALPSNLRVTCLRSARTSISHLPSTPPGARPAVELTGYLPSLCTQLTSHLPSTPPGARFVGAAVHPSAAHRRRLVRAPLLGGGILGGPIGGASTSSLRPTASSHRPPPPSPRPSAGTCRSGGRATVRSK